ncbi:MAG: hypothetical protein ACXVYB_06235, partial [Arthrobacter sp.]
AVGVDQRIASTMAHHIRAVLKARHSGRRRYFGVDPAVVGGLAAVVDLILDECVCNGVSPNCYVVRGSTCMITLLKKTG